ncbi:MAG: ATP-binding protein [Candidatus Muiribacteriota bacterium]
MLTKEEIKNIINSYNMNAGVIRQEYVDKLYDYVFRKEILILKGIRRCGKTTIQKQLIKKLGIKNCFYVNLDDYRFLDYLSIELLEKILEVCKKDEKKYLFLDEIQNIPKFESWLRTQYERGTKVKFIISGSNSKLLTKEYGSLLTGRSLTFEITPLSFSEFMKFTKEGLNEYLEFGGFPEVVLEKDTEKKKQLLVNYFDAIVEKDLILKYDISQHKQLKQMLKYIMLNPGIRISANKLSKQLGISINTVKSYLSLAEEAYLVFEVPFFSHSAKTKFIGSRVSKYYSIDNGFYHVFATRQEKSKLYENLVALHFFKKREDLYYWFGNNEVDFVYNGTAINVVSSKQIPKREFQGLNEINAKNKLIVAPFTDKTQNIISLEEFLTVYNI